MVINFPFSQHLHCIRQFIDRKIEKSPVDFIPVINLVYRDLMIWFVQRLLNPDFWNRTKKLVNVFFSAFLTAQRLCLKSHEYLMEWFVWISRLQSAVIRTWYFLRFFTFFIRWREDMHFEHFFFPKFIDTVSNHRALRKVYESTGQSINQKNLSST